MTLMRLELVQEKCVLKILLFLSINFIQELDRNKPHFIRISNFCQAQNRNSPTNNKATNHGGPRNIFGQKHKKWRQEREKEEEKTGKWGGKP